MERGWVGWAVGVTQLLGRAIFRVAVGIAVARYPPHRSVRADFPHTAPTLDEWRQSEHSDMDA